MSREQKADSDQLLRLTALVRRLFHGLASAWDKLHEDLGVSASMRSVLQAVAKEDRTVPDIAREKGVARQHIQTIVNQLIGKRLVQKIDNPEHRKSSLISLSDAGKSLLAEISVREAQLIPVVAKHMHGRELDETSQTLATLLSFLDSPAFLSATEQAKQTSTRQGKT